MTNYVYHGSPVGGLAFIEPKLSTHGKSWVYATKSKAVALTFLQNWNDYLLNLSINDDGLPELTERVPGAFKDIYSGKSGFIYYLDSSTFSEGQTHFEPEVVSEVGQEVINCEKIADCYAKMCEMESRGEISLFSFPNRPYYIPEDDTDLLENSRYFLKHKQDKKALIDYAAEKHPKLKNALLALLAEESII